MILGFLGVMLFTLLIGYTESLVLTQLGVPEFIVMFIGLVIGFYLPGVLIRWIYKEEIAELKSRSDEE